MGDGGNGGEQMGTDGWVQLSMIRPPTTCVFVRLYMCVRMRWWTDAFFYAHDVAIHRGRVGAHTVYCYVSVRAAFSPVSSVSCSPASWFWIGSLSLSRCCV